MRDYLSIGSTPVEENCCQVGTEAFQRFGRQECEVYKQQLQLEFPAGSFKVKAFPHDFGTYYEVVAYYDDDAENDEQAAAFDAEGEANPCWTPESIATLQRIAADKGWIFNDEHKFVPA